MLNVRYTHGYRLSLLLVFGVHFVFISARFLEVSGTYQQSNIPGSHGGSAAVHTWERSRFDVTSPRQQMYPPEHICLVLVTM